jgi:hypothetical protein
MDRQQEKDSVVGENLAVYGNLFSYFAVATSF